LPTSIPVTYRVIERSVSSGASVPGLNIRTAESPAATFSPLPTPGEAWVLPEIGSPVLPQSVASRVEANPPPTVAPANRGSMYNEFPEIEQNILKSIMEYRTNPYRGQVEEQAGEIAAGHALMPGFNLRSRNPLVKWGSGVAWDLYNYLAPVGQVALSIMLPPYERGEWGRMTSNTNAAFNAAQPTLASIPVNGWGSTLASLFGIPVQGGRAIINPAAAVNTGIIGAGLLGGTAAGLAEKVPALEGLAAIRLIDPMTYIAEGGAEIASPILRWMGSAASAAGRGLGLGLGGLGARIASPAAASILQRMGYTVASSDLEEAGVRGFRGPGLLLIPINPIEASPYLRGLSDEELEPALHALYGEYSNAWWRDFYRGLEDYFNAPRGTLMSRGLEVNPGLWDTLRLRIGMGLEDVGRRLLTPLRLRGAPLIQAINVEEVAPGEEVYNAEAVRSGRIRVPTISRGFQYYNPRGVVAAVTSGGVIPLGLSVGRATPGAATEMLGVMDVVEASPFRFAVTRQPYTTSTELGEAILNYLQSVRALRSASRSLAAGSALTDQSMSPLGRLLAAASEYVLPSSLTPILPADVSEYWRAVNAAAAANILHELEGGVGIGGGRPWWIYFSEPETAQAFLESLQEEPRAVIHAPPNLMRTGIREGLPGEAIYYAGMYPPTTPPLPAREWEAVGNALSQLARAAEKAPQVAPLSRIPEDTMLAALGLRGAGPIVLPNGERSLVGGGIISELLGEPATGYEV
ncbi:MAG: hypothetical protein ACP5NY_09150, partial [Thermocladium sp.]